MIAPTGSSHLKGIALMVAAVSVFSCLDASAKYLAASMDTAQIVWVRFLGHLLIALICIVPPFGPGHFRSGNLKLQLLRSAFLLGSTVCNFFSLQYLHLGETAPILFSAPLMVTALSVPVLGEQVGPRRWAAIVTGFIGVMIIIRPGFHDGSGNEWALFLPVLTALAAAAYMLTTRMLAGTDGPATTQLYTPLFGFIALTPFAPFHWTPPEGIEILVLVATGTFGAEGHLLLILAHRLAPAPVLAPFAFTQILSMTLLGYLVFGHVPDRWTLCGGAVVVASGLYLLARERKRADSAMAIQPAANTTPENPDTSWTGRA